MVTANSIPQLAKGVVSHDTKLTRDEVMFVYHKVLGRLPENEAVVADKLAKINTVFDLVLNLVKSREFKQIMMAKDAPVQLDHLILVGTHHKTGTEWMGDVFRTIANLLHLKFHNGVQSNLGADSNIFMQVDSFFELERLRAYRGLHIIRDPRDVIISGAAYHEKTTEEDWLQEPNAAFGGLSYQAKLRTFDNLYDKLVFEMKHRGKQTINQMGGWNYANENIIEVKYEDLIVDNELELFSRIFLFLGLSGPALPVCLDVAWTRSIFSGALKKHGVHIRSGRPQQWRNVFTKALGREFLGQFGDVLVRLGYETDASWINELAGE